MPLHSSSDGCDLSCSVFLFSILGHIALCPISYKGFPVCRMEEEAVVGHFFFCSSEGAWLSAPSKVGVWLSGNSLGAVGFLCFSAVAELAAAVPQVVGVRRELAPCCSSAGNHSNLLKGTAGVGSPQSGVLTLYLSKALIEGLESPAHRVSMGRPPAVAGITAVPAGFEEQHQKSL